MTSSSLMHHALPLAAGRHTIHNWEYADSTARLAATVSVDDVYKIALQLDDQSLWLLVDDSPLTWASLGAVTDDHVLAVIAGSVLPGDGIDATDNAGPFDRTFSLDLAYVAAQLFLDEDDFAANSNTKVPTQQSTKAYVDAAIIAAGSYTDEQARDALGAALTAGTGITVTPNDGANTITIATTITQYTDEMARDALGTALTAGTGITVTPNDGADTITIASSITQYTDELAEDAVGGILTDTASIDFTYNDGANTITADIKDEYLMDWLGALLTDSTSIDWTYDDAGNAITVVVKDEYVQDTVGAMALDSTSIDFTYDDSGATLTAVIKDEYLMDWLGALISDSTNIDVTYNDGANTFAIDLTAAAKTFTVNFVIDGGGSVITTGIKGVVQVDRACTIISNTVLGDQSGSITVTIKKVAYASFPGSLTSIVASAKPTLSSSQKSTDATLTGWTTSVSAGDILEYTVDSITTCTRVTVALKMQAA